MKKWNLKEREAESRICLILHSNCRDLSALFLTDLAQEFPLFICYILFKVGLDFYFGIDSKIILELIVPGTIHIWVLGSKTGNPIQDLISSM